MNEQEKMVLAFVEEHRDDMIRFLGKLVKIDTQTPQASTTTSSATSWRTSSAA
jgi:hypothetical protein